MVCPLLEFLVDGLSLDCSMVGCLVDIMGEMRGKVLPYILCKVKAVEWTSKVSHSRT